MAVNTFNRCTLVFEVLDGHEEMKRQSSASAVLVLIASVFGFCSHSVLMTSSTYSVDFLGDF